MANEEGGGEQEEMKRIKEEDASGGMGGVHPYIKTVEKRKEKVGKTPH